MQRRYRKKQPEKTLTKRFNTNERIRSDEVRVIGADGENLGVMKTSEALEKAHEEELDLIEVSPKANPPVVRIGEYGQFKYEQEKKAKKQRALQKKHEVKGIRLTFRIKGADLDNRAQQALKFLDAGNNVKIDMILRGRERQHREKALQLVREFIQQLGDDISIVAPASAQGGRISSEVSRKQPSQSE